MSEITCMLQAVGRGEAVASEELLPLIYNDLRRHAGVQMARESAGQTLQPTALVHEAWLRMMGDGNVWQNRAHFFGAASEAMRRILIERARARCRARSRSWSSVADDRRFLQPVADGLSRRGAALYFLGATTIRSVRPPRLECAR